MKQIQSAVILSAVPLDPSMARYLQPGDFVVACDAGYQNAARLGIHPDLIVGDFDSAPRPAAMENTIVLPHVKDDTDTHYAARWLAEHGCRRVTMLGVLGGKRLEHTIANLATGLYLAQKGIQVRLADAQSEVYYLLPGQPLVLEREHWKYLSLFPMDGILRDVSMQGVFYPLHNAVLTVEYPLGVSNEFVADQACLQCSSGHGVVILTCDDK